MVISVVTIGSIKLNGLISSNQKASYYSKLSENFHRKIAAKLPNFKLAQYGDDKAGKIRFKIEGGEITGKKFSKFEEMRDYCYKLAEKEDNYKSCNGKINSDGCYACAS